jgi:hypothetical protein
MLKEAVRALVLQAYKLANYAKAGSSSVRIKVQDT